MLRGMHAPHSGVKPYIDKILASSCNNIVPYSSNAQALRVEAMASADDPGLDLELGGSNSLDATNGSVLGGQTGSKNAYVGLRWDVLRSGWKENKLRAGRLDAAANAADIRARMDYERRLNQCRADKVHQAFLPLQATLMQSKLDLLRILWRLQLQSYLSGNAFFDDALSIEQELQVAANDLARMQPELARLAPFQMASVISPPILDVNLEVALSAIERDPRLQQLVELEKTALENRAKEKDSDRLLIALRYEASGTGLRKRGVTGAVRYTMPLFEHADRGMIERQVALGENSSAVTAQRVRDTRHAYGKFNDERELTLRQWYRYQRVMERVRRSLGSEHFDPKRVDTGAAAQRAMEAVDAAIELARAKELLYRRAAEVVSTGQLLYTPDFVKLAPVVNSAYRGRAGARSVYMWSKTFNAYPNDFLFSFLRSKGVQTVILSAGTKTDRNKMKAFLVNAKAAHIRIEMLFSDNHWLDAANYHTAVSRIISVAKLDEVLHQSMSLRREEGRAVQGRHLAMQSLGGHSVRLSETDEDNGAYQQMGSGMIHLDIEPHAMDQYRGKPAEIQRVYMGMLTYLREQLPKSIKISVSLPTNWQTADYQRIGELADHIYMMDYGSPKVERILRHLNAVRAAVPDARLTLALRTKDFTSEWQMEQAFNAVAEQTSIRRFAIHAAGSYLHLSSEKAASAVDRIMLKSRSLR